jgi:urease accessory protein UreF
VAQPSSTLRSLIRLASPSLPVGGFSHAEGLEAAVDAGRLHDESGAGDWLLQQLELAHGRADAPAVARAAALAAVAAQAPAGALRDGRPEDAQRPGRGGALHRGARSAGGLTARHGAATPVQ